MIWVSNAIVTWEKSPIYKQLISVSSSKALKDDVNSDRNLTEFGTWVDEYEAN